MASVASVARGRESAPSSGEKHTPERTDCSVSTRTRDVFSVCRDARASQWYSEERRGAAPSSHALVVRFRPTAT